jgi:hypothetical protein
MVITFRHVLSKQTATYALYNINSSVFITEVECLQRGKD